MPISHVIKDARRDADPGADALRPLAARWQLPLPAALLVLVGFLGSEISRGPASTPGCDMTAMTT